MKENQVPVVHAARRVPISVKNKLKKTLDAMENEKNYNSNIYTY